MKSIIDSRFGVFCEVSGKSKFVTVDNEDGLVIKRKIEGSGGEPVLQVEVHNVGDKEIRVNAFMVAEFDLEGKIEKVLENGWGQSSFSGYRTEVRETKLNRLFLKRDQNPNSFREDFGYISGSLVSEWFTQIVLTERCYVIGAVTTKDQFSQIYLKKNDRGTLVRITSQTDRLVLKPGEKILSEKVVIVQGEKIKKTLDNFADLIKKYSKTRSVDNPPVGLCCAYYFQGNVVSEDYLFDQLRALSLFAGRTDLQFIEIDAGYCVWGDWTEINKNFPSGMEAIVKEIQKQKLRAGIWFAPFVASPKSKVYKEHSDWFLKDKLGRDIEGRQNSPVDFISSLSLKVLDPTNPQVQEYLIKVVRQFLSWGFEMIKIDFTYPVCFADHYFLPVTRAQALRIGYDVIRKEAGEKTHLMSAITQLSPLVGVVDSARVGIDTINPYVSKIPVLGKMINNLMFKESMRNSCTRLFLNGKVWINDADCFIGRQKTGLTNKQVDEQFDFIKKNPGAVWIGDSLKMLTKTNLDKYADLFRKKDEK